MMNAINTIIYSYSHALDIIPANVRTLVAFAILIILVVLFLKFVKKSIIWMVVFILLLPTAYPALRQIFTAFWQHLIQPFLK